MHDLDYERIAEQSLTHDARWEDQDMSDDWVWTQEFNPGERIMISVEDSIREPGKSVLIIHQMTKVETAPPLGERLHCTICRSSGHHDTTAHDEDTF